MSEKYVLQRDTYDCGLAALKTIFLQFGKKILVELETDKVNILTYNTSADIINNTPTKLSTNFTIGVDNNGLPKIEFTLQGENYYFCNFGADGKAKTFERKAMALFKQWHAPM